MASRNGISGAPQYQDGDEYDTDEEVPGPKLVVEDPADAAAPAAAVVSAAGAPVSVTAAGSAAAAAPAAAAANDDEKDIPEEIKKTWWPCPVCTYVNKPNELPPDVPKDICAVCGEGTRPGTELGSPSGAGRPMMMVNESGRPVLMVTPEQYDQLRSMMGQPALPKKLTVANDIWNCAVCTLENDAYVHMCAACNSSLPARALALGQLAKICMDILTHPDEPNYRTVQKADVKDQLLGGGSVVPLMQNLGFVESDTAFTFPAEASLPLLKDAFVRIRTDLLDGPKMARALMLQELMGHRQSLSPAEAQKITYDAFNNMPADEKNAIKLVSPEHWATYTIMGAQLAVAANDWETALQLYDSCVEPTSDSPLLQLKLMVGLAECYAQRTAGVPADNNMKALYFQQQAQLLQMAIQAQGPVQGCGNPNCMNCGGRGAIVESE